MAVSSPQTPAAYGPNLLSTSSSPFSSLLFLFRLSSSSHPLLILHPLYPECYHLLVSLHQGIISYFQYFNRFFFSSWRSDGRKNLEEGYFFSSPVLFRFVVAGQEPFSIWRGKALQIETNWEGDGMEKVGGGKEGRRRRSGKEKREKEGNGDWWQQPCA